MRKDKTTGGGACATKPNWPKLIAGVRDARGWSQEELARKLGVSRATVNRWEGGIRKPSPALQKQLLKLAG